jgi:eukaryotic-like serine/threonine-protein kinase
MGLASGTRLGVYEVLGSLGAGGMGEVYRARDSKLNRDVALKVLPEAFSAEPDRLARFEREAQLIASLNHPNIAAIYGFEQSNGIYALVLELVEGPTLADRLDRGPIPVDEALPIARQIAQALEASHELGIIHRDLKPANIKLRPDGTVKVLDFGLAKALEPVGTEAGSATASPTITSPATQIGVILGTAAYMSPEQAKGRPADKRSDVWAFGAVLFEMLSGQRAFKGDDVADTLAAVLRADPKWSDLPPATPQAVRRLLTRCLQKDPKRRLQHIGDVRLELEEVEPSDLDRASNGATRSTRSMWPIIAAAVVGAALAGLTAWSMAPAPVDRPPSRFAIQVPSSAPLLTGRFGLAGGLALSPDGRAILYSTGSGLVSRQLDTVPVEPVRGAEGGAWPFFSPDGVWIGFFADGKIKKVPARSGLAVTICDTPANARAVWADDDTIVVARTDLYRVAASGGALEKIVDAGGEQFSEPEFLPGSNAVLVRARMPPAQGHIEAIDLQTRTRHRLLEGSTPKLAAGGALLFARDQRIWATGFDAKRLAVNGTPVPIIESVRLVEAEALFATSRDGTLIYMAGDVEATASIVWLDRTGKTSAALDDQRNFRLPRLSPDGKQVAVSVASGSSLDLWTFDLGRGSRLRLTTVGSNRRTVWSPDGTQIAYFSLPSEPGQGADQDLYVVPSLGGAAKRILTRPGPQWPDSWSPDGRFLIFEDGPGGVTRDLWLLPFGEDPRPLVVSRFNERGAVFSPDGRWIAFVSDESGRAEVYIQPFPGPGPKIPVSNEGGLQPVWGKSGRELYYRAADALMEVPVRLNPLQVSAARKLLDLPRAIYGFDQFTPDYDVAADGRFLAIRRDASIADEITVVLNWTQELRRALGR